MKNAKSKLENIFTDNKMHGTIKIQLLGMNMKNFLEYFKEIDKEIKAFLNTVLLSKVNKDPI